MWGGADGERMELSWILSSACYLDPLPSLIVEVEWSLEVDTNHERWKDVSTDNTQFLLPATNADDLVNGINDTWT